MHRVIASIGSVLLLVTAFAISTDAVAKKGGNGNGGGGSGSDDPLGGDYTGTTGVTIIEPSTIAGFEVDITGGSGNDTAYGGAKKDYIQGLAGSDTLHGNGDNDFISGGADNDVAFGGDGDDDIYGDDGDDVLLGEGGTDNLVGGAGDDILIFSLGAAIPGGYDVDSYDGGDGNDTLDLSDTANQVSIDFEGMTYTANASDANGIATVVAGSFTGIENVWGTVGDDLLDGSLTGADDLYGNDGEDLISGYGGDDILEGGSGNDRIFGGDGNDIVDGGLDADYLDGGPGDDTLIGYEGGASSDPDDTMVGGTGCDTFYFNREFGVDTIMDFEDGCDVIDVSGYNAGFYGIKFSDISISESGSDIVIDIRIKKGGGTGGTIILAGASGTAVIDESDFIL